MATSGKEMPKYQLIRKTFDAFSSGSRSFTQHDVTSRSNGENKQQPEPLFVAEDFASQCRIFLSIGRLDSCLVFV